MKVVDELFTPGCPQCAVKHLSAALYHVARGAVQKDVFPNPYMTCVCTAYINLVEVRAGYHSHLWYAVGALVRAEELAAQWTSGCVAREARLMLEQRGEEALPDALNCIQEGMAPNHADWAAAHFDEARRELPAFADEMRMDDLIGSIEKIREEFFPKNDLAGATVAPEEGNTNQEGEPTMATAKKACKGTKCAAKGGKTAKACGKSAKAGDKSAKACDKGGKAKR